jgi:CheY-like chemotaxis protein
MENKKTLRVFIVDDNELARHLVKNVVQSQGLEVCAEAKNGQEAVEMVQNMQPDLIILDFMMPVKDGLQAAREILKVQPSVPIVLNTLYFTEQLRSVAEDIGVKQVISKSNYQSLRDALSTLLQAESAPSIVPN